VTRAGEVAFPKMAVRVRRAVVCANAWRQPAAIIGASGLARPTSALGLATVKMLASPGTTMIVLLGEHRNQIIKAEILKYLSTVLSVHVLPLVWQQLFDRAAQHSRSLGCE
jgi:hypothetical protein